jgi:hypothetical protein
MKPSSMCGAGARSRCQSGRRNAAASTTTTAVVAHRVGRDARADRLAAGAGAILVSLVSVVTIVVRPWH